MVEHEIIPATEAVSVNDSEEPRADADTGEVRDDFPDYFQFRARIKGTTPLKRKDGITSLEVTFILQAPNEDLVTSIEPALQMLAATPEDASLNVLVSPEMRQTPLF